MTKKNLAWLASYPKSGNTWTRIFLANYLINRPRPLSLTDISLIGHGDAKVDWYRKFIDGEFNPKNDLHSFEARPKVLRGIAANGADVNFVKTHNQNNVVSGFPLIPPELTRCAVYFVRNPLDVVGSFAAHYSKTIDDSVKCMNDEQWAIGATDQQVRQFVGTWSAHVVSWTQQKKFPVHIMRYEDMLEHPAQMFGGMLKFLGVPVEAQRLMKAVRFSSFNQVSKQEEIQGFNEKLERQEKFFRSGKSGQWKDELTPAQTERIRNDHGNVMQKFGYEV